MIREYINGYIDSKLNGNKQKIGIGGFTAFARVSDSTKYSASAPNVALEDGSIATDHIINNPVELTISGNVSDVFLKPDALYELQRKAIATAGLVTRYLPLRTQSQLSVINSIANDITAKLDLVDSVIGTGISIASVFGFGPNAGMSNREQFIQILEAYYYAKTLMSIETKYRTFDNMSITELTITRDNQNDALTFSLSAKQVNFASLVYTDSSKFFKNPSGDAASQTQGEKDKGTQSPSKPKSLLSFLGG